MPSPPLPFHLFCTKGPKEIVAPGSGPQPSRARARRDAMGSRLRAGTRRSPLGVSQFGEEQYRRPYAYAGWPLSV